MEYLEKLYAFARENGYKVKDLNVNERRNQRGRYDYVELVLIIPREEPARKLETIVHELEEELEKDEVIRNEI